jgi:hypothetical protein
MKLAEFHFYNGQLKQKYFLKQICKKLPDNYTTISDHLFLANVYKAVQEKVYSKIKQIQPDEYNWIKDEQLNECLLRMSDIMKDELIDKDKVEIEKTIITYDDENKHKKIDEILKEHIPEITKFRFHARIDALTPYSIWELKCVGHITKEHLLQVVIYAWLWRLTTNEEREFKIFNVKTAQVLQLNATTDQLTYIICILLKNKFKVQETKTDEEFIEDCKGIITNITNK